MVFFLWRIYSREKEIAFNVLDLIFFPKSYALCFMLCINIFSFFITKTL